MRRTPNASRLPYQAKIPLLAHGRETIIPHAMQKQLNRRQFLKAASVATVTAPSLFSAWAASGRKGPNDRITLGFIGTGTQGRGLLNNFLNHPDTQVVAVSDVDTTRREHHRKLAEEFYTIKGTTEFK